MSRPLLKLGGGSGDILSDVLHLSITAARAPWSLRGRDGDLGRGGPATSFQQGGERLVVRCDVCVLLRQEPDLRFDHTRDAEFQPVDVRHGRGARRNHRGDSWRW